MDTKFTSDASFKGTNSFGRIYLQVPTSQKVIPQSMQGLENYLREKKEFEEKNYSRKKRSFIPQGSKNGTVASGEWLKEINRKILKLEKTTKGLTEEDLLYRKSRKLRRNGLCGRNSWRLKRVLADLCRQLPPWHKILKHEAAVCQRRSIAWKLAIQELPRESPNRRSKERTRHPLGNCSTFNIFHSSLMEKLIRFANCGSSNNTGEPYDQVLATQTTSSRVHCRDHANIGSEKWKVKCETLTLLSWNSVRATGMSKSSAKGTRSWNLVIIRKIKTAHARNMQ